jgi:acetyl esterase/lipase
MHSTLTSTAAEYEVVNRPGLVFAEHDGVKLVGDFYLPKGRSKAPVLVAIHGGGWQVGSREFYNSWGPFLARNGYALFAIEYRLAKQGVYPAAVYDAKAAVQFVRAKAGEFDVDPDRIGLIGDSAGAHLSALVALAGDQLTTGYRDDAHAAVPAGVKAVVGFYGVYDLMAQWTHDQVARPRDPIVEKFLGTSPMVNRRIYFDASPINHATVDRNQLRVLLIHGTNDDIVDSETQSGAFLTALAQAQFFVRRIILPGAGHFWSADPFEDEPQSYNALVVPRLLRFLETSL